MAKLAGSDLSRQAIFLIEAGKSRPSMRTLELIANRTGKPVSFFARAGGGPISAGPLIEELQGLCLKQEFDKAIQRGEEMLADNPPRRLEAHIRQYVGQAYVRSVRPDEGIAHLQRAREILEDDPDPWLDVECTDWYAAALYYKQDKRALSVAEHSLKLCRSTEPRLPGTEARILEHIASIHVRNHSYDKAIAFYEEALKVAGSVRDLSRLGRTYHGLSIAYQERGELERAVEFTHKALALYGLEHDTAMLARGENELGLLLMRQGQTRRAEEAFVAALSHLDESGTEVAKSQVLLSLAELHGKTGRHKEAIATARQAMELARRLGESLALAEGHELLGRFYEQIHRPRVADREREAGIRILREEGLTERLAESHAAYAEILEARGQPARAAAHWKKAATLSLRRAGTAVASGSA
jgi:tetratricopeptide (TPR) repeat protein